MAVIPFEFRRDFWHQKTRVPPWDIVWRCLRDPMFSRFGTVPACDGRTDGQRTTAYTTPRLHSVAR